MNKMIKKGKTWKRQLNNYKKKEKSIMRSRIRTKTIKRTSKKKRSDNDDAK